MKRSFTSFKTGFAFIFRGGRTVWKERGLWPHLVIPVFLNIVLFLAVLYAGVMLVRGFLIDTLPATWWGIALTVVLVTATVLGLLYIGAAVFVSVGAIISAPFYDHIAGRLLKKQGAVIVERSFFRQLWFSIKNGFGRFGMFLGAQLVVFIGAFLPGIGTIWAVLAGFLVTVLFVALSFLDYAFDAAGLDWRARLRWARRHGAVMIGFGTGGFLLLVVPALNLILPPIAIAGAIELFFDADES